MNKKEIVERIGLLSALSGLGILVVSAIFLVRHDDFALTVGGVGLGLIGLGLVLKCCPISFCTREDNKLTSRTPLLNNIA